MTGPERLTLSGNTYFAYDFDTFPINAAFHPIAAVYVVTRRTAQAGAAEHDVLYIGETAKLQDHFADHPEADCFRQHGGDCVGMHRQEDEASRRETVDLVPQLRPPYNVRSGDRFSGHVTSAELKFARAA